MAVSELSSKGILGMYYRKLKQDLGVQLLSLLTFKIKSTQKTETYKWLGDSPAMREWVGGRLVKGFETYGIAGTNVKYESTIEFDRDDRREDKTDQVRVRINEHARRALVHPWKLLCSLISNGASSLCYDGQYFFDTDHSDGISGLQSNALTFNAATGTTPTVNEMADAIMQAIQAINSYVDSQGEPLNEDGKAFTILVPNNLWGKTQAAIKNEFLTNGQTNTLVNAGLELTPFSTPRLTDPNRFYVFRTDGDVKPFIFQERDPLAVSAKAEGSEYEHDTDKHQFGLRWEGTMVYGLWQSAVQTTFT